MHLPIDQNNVLQALAVIALTNLEDVGVRGMKHEITMGNICSSNNNNKVADFELMQNVIESCSKSCPFQGGSKPPRDLTCLLEESGEGTPWFDLFKQFLRHRDQVVLVVRGPFH